MGKQNRSRHSQQGIADLSKINEEVVMTKLSAQRTYSKEGPECPYCGRQYTPDEGYYYDADNYTKQECDECGKTFSVEVYHSTSWTCDAIEETPQVMPGAER